MTNKAIRVKALDLCYVMQHALLAGQMGIRWENYDPTECSSYHRLTALQARHDNLLDELYQLKLLICGGEDAPGSANMLTLAEAETMLTLRDADEIEDRLNALQARCDKLEAVVRDALQFVEVIEKVGRDEGDEYAATTIAKALRSVVDGGE